MLWRSVSRSMEGAPSRLVERFGSSKVYLNTPMTERVNVAATLVPAVVAKIAREVWQTLC